MCFARLLFGLQKQEACTALLQTVRTALEKSDDRHMQGELELVSALSDFPDLAKMRARFAKAATLLNGPSRLVLSTDLYMFGALSMFNLFHLQAGHAEEEARLLEEVIELHSSMCNGHGRGADLLFHAELAWVLGDGHEALIQAYKAETTAEEAQQESILVGALLLQGKIAKLNEDWDTVAEIRANLLQRRSLPSVSWGYAQREHMLRTALEMLAAPKAQEPSHKPTVRVLYPLSWFSQLVDLSRLAKNGQYAKLISRIEAQTPAAGLSPVLHLLYKQIFLAISYSALGKQPLSEQYLAQALDLAKQSHIYQPFYENRASLSGLDSPRLGFLDKEADMPKKEQPEDTEKSALLNELTSREREIARYAAEGMRNKEIAAILYLSEGTVRNHLNVAFQKLEIDRRSKLAEFLPYL